jgi:hypothetical protein
MKEEFFHLTEGQHIRCFMNVSEYSWKEHPEFAWHIHYESEKPPDSADIPIYFILDSGNSGAFSHWVYENATWLPFFLEVKAKYPSCYLVVETKKQYKSLYLSLYGISSDCLRFHSEVESSNFCFFHTYTSLNDKNIPPIYYSNLFQHIQMLENNMPAKDMNILYLPRGTKENISGPNNRVYNIQEDLKQVVKGVGGVVFETDTTSDLREQIELVRRSKILIVDYGSNLWVNGTFAHNSKILCLNTGWKQHIQYPALGVLWNFISKTNSIDQIFACPLSATTSEGVSIVHFDMKQILEYLFKN